MTKRIYKFDFEDKLASGASAHVALVDQAANLQEVLVMKALHKDNDDDSSHNKQVTVSLSMLDFLQSFMGMWYSDAKALAVLLGFDSEDDLNEDFDQHIMDKIESISILKGKDIPKELPESMVTKIEELQKSLGDKLETSSLGEDNNKSNKEESTQMAKEKTEGKDVTKSKDEATTTISASELIELRKSVQEGADLKLQVEEMQKAADKKVRLETTEVVKGYGLFEDDDVETAVNFIMKSSSIEGGTLILQALEKARTVVSKYATEEHGSDLENKDTEKSMTKEDEAITTAVTSILKSRGSID